MQYKKSKFSDYYSRLIALNKINKTEKYEKINNYYRPKLFQLIKDQLYLMPLWSGVIIRMTGIQHHCHYLMNITRLSNNLVENHFGYIKNHIFGNKRYSQVK